MATFTGAAADLSTADAAAAAVYLDSDTDSSSPFWSWFIAGVWTVPGWDTLIGGDGSAAGTTGGGGELVGGVAAPGLEARNLPGADLGASTYRGGSDGVVGAAGAFVHVDGGPLVVQAGGSYLGGDSAGVTFEGGTGAAFCLSGGGAGTLFGSTFKPGQNAAINYDGIACALAAKDSSTWDVYGGDFGFTALSQWLALAIEPGSSVTLHGSGLAFDATSMTFTGGTLSDGSTVGGLGVRDYTPGGTLSASGSGSSVTFSA